MNPLSYGENAEVATTICNKKKTTVCARHTVALERLMGVEPTSEAWEASILPMNYSRIYYKTFFESFTILPYIVSSCKPLFTERLQRTKLFSMVLSELYIISIGLNPPYFAGIMVFHIFHLVFHKIERHFPLFPPTFPLELEKLLCNSVEKFQKNRFT